LSERWLGKDEPAWERDGTWSQMKYGRFIRSAGGWPALQRVLRAAQHVAERHGVSITNVATRFVMEQPGVAAVIVGARLGERAHIDDNARLCEFALTAGDRAHLDAAIATLDAIPGDCGDEYRRPPFLTATGDLSHHLESFPPPYEVRAGPNGSRRCFSGTTWEPLAGYARAVRSGRRIVVSGTTATHGGRLLGGADPAAQTHAVIDKIDGALQALGGRLEDVIRTRVFVSSLDHWEPVARAHGQRFGAVQPANTLVEARLVGPEYLVEIEAAAELGARDASRRRGARSHAADRPGSGCTVGSRHADRPHAPHPPRTARPPQRRRDLGEVGRRQPHGQHEGPDGALDDPGRGAARRAETRRSRGGLYGRQHGQLPGDGVCRARLHRALRVVGRLLGGEAADDAGLRRDARRREVHRRQGHAGSHPGVHRARARAGG
jgi:enamine deaminase RidA (YjgF/YER057c/UK114 family)